MMWLGIALGMALGTGITLGLLWWGMRLIDRAFLDDKRGPHDL